MIFAKTFTQIFAKTLANVWRFQILNIFASNFHEYRKMILLSPNSYHGKEKKSTGYNL
jgi:hypothetical protein